jgi:acetoin utilization deacetylase AcuC-like enzyme
MKTGIITTDTYSNHDTGQGHPERADRVTVIIDYLKKVKSKNLIWKKPAKFDLKYLEFAHTKNYLNNVKDSFPKHGLNFLDGDTIVSPGSKDATRDAVGSILTAIDGVMKKNLDNAFCAVRPPGHHAEKALSKFFFITPSMAVRIDPTASLVASLLPGDTMVSPSKKLRPCLGKESFTLFR